MPESEPSDTEVVMGSRQRRTVGGREAEAPSGQRRSSWLGHDSRLHLGIDGECQGVVSGEAHPDHSVRAPASDVSRGEVAEPAGTSARSVRGEHAHLPADADLAQAT